MDSRQARKGAEDCSVCRIMEWLEKSKLGGDRELSDKKSKSTGELKKKSTGELKKGKIEFWHDEQGRPCIGNECFTITSEGKDVKIQIHEDKCPTAVVDGFAKLMGATVARGGATLYQTISKKLEPKDE